MNLDALIEAVLFASAQPMSGRKLADVLSQTPEEVDVALEADRKSVV